MQELTRSRTSGWFSFAIERDALSSKSGICSAIRQAVGDWRGASRQGRCLCNVRFLGYRRRRRKRIQ
jgi:hypothetical protein